jgi:hypothetical protein
MAVAFDAVGPSATGTSSTTSPLSWTHTIGAVSNSGILVGVGVDIGTDTGVSVSATCGGTAMTALGVVHSDNATAGFLAVFGLVAPGTGAKAITATTTGGSPDSITGGSISFSGADQAAPYTQSPLSGVNYGNGTAVTATTTGSITGDLMAGFAVAGHAFSSAAAPSTSRFLAAAATLVNAGGAVAGATSPATGSGVGMGWTLAGTDWWGVNIIEVKQPSVIAPVKVYSISQAVKRSSLW